MKKPYKITCRELGRGKGSITSFATLADAEVYIKDRWQGADYIDSNESFHGDYATFELTGFTLRDIGRIVLAGDWREFTFNSDLKPAVARTPEEQAADYQAECERAAGC